MRALYNIRKLFTAVSPLLLFANIGMATTPSSSIIGKVFNNDGRSVSLYAVENGRAVKMGFQWPSEDGTFHFNFPLASESIFFVTEGGFVPEQFLHPQYVKPGNTVELKLFNGRLSSDFDSIQVVTANRETLILQRWADIMSPLNSIGRKLNCHEQYFSLYNQVRQQGLDLAEKINTNNAYFNYLF